MGINASYRRVTLQEFAALQADPEAAKAFFGLDLDFRSPEAIFSELQRRDDDELYFNLEKDWHALHFLLTGESSLEGT